jgi:hypothetical protein
LVHGGIPFGIEGALLGHIPTEELRYAIRTVYIR